MTDDLLIQKLIDTLRDHTTKDNLRVSLDIAFFLISKCSNVQKYSDILYQVAQLDDTELLEKFVNLGCDMFVKDAFNTRPLDIAIRCGNCKVVEWFLNRGDFSNEPCSGLSRLLLICKRRYVSDVLDNGALALKMAQLFVKYGADLLNVNYSCQQTPLEAAYHFYGKNHPLTHYLKDATEKQKQYGSVNGLMSHL